MQAGDAGCQRRDLSPIDKQRRTGAVGRNGALWQLLEKGRRIFYMRPPFDHTKLMIVDGIWTLIGSTNWDPRSLRLNFEFNVECYDEQLARSLNHIVDEKTRSAREVTLDEVNGRSFRVRLRDGLARLLTPYLS